MAEKVAESLIYEYVQALGLWAVFVMAGAPEGPIRLRVGTDKIASARERQLGIETRGAIWFRSENFASACADGARRLIARGPRAWFAFDVVGGLELIRAAAISNKISFATDDKIEANAIASIAHIGKVFDKMRTDGGLQQLNRKYRSHRIAESIAGRPVPPFPSWLREYKRRMIALAAETSLQMDRACFGLIGDKSDTGDNEARKLVSA